MALIPVLEFFKNIPPKKCLQCGHETTEMHDCYTHKCEKCEVDIIENK